MKKVEVYFLINLGAILSLFAIEGELSIYMQRQDDILKNVAQDKLQTLVEVSNVESNYDDPDYYRLLFDVDGQYEKGSIEFTPSFTTPIVEVGDEGVTIDEEYEWELDSVTIEPYADEGDSRYVAKVKLSSVEENYLNQPFNVSLGVKFIPDIDSVTYNKWSDAFGSYKVTDKLLKIINSEVSREGSFGIDRSFDTPVTLIYMDGQQSEFFVLFDKEKYSSAQYYFKEVINKFDNPQDEIRINAEYYFAVCALKLYHRNVETILSRFALDHPDHPKSKNIYFQLGKHYYQTKKFKKSIDAGLLKIMSKMGMFQEDIQDKKDSWLTHLADMVELANEKAKKKKIKLII